MSAEIIPFDFEEQAVRVILRGDDPWFVAADVCRVLEIANNRDAVGRLDDDEHDDVGIADTIGRNQQMTIISESGLYALVLTSRKDAAKRFRKWITAEVLPAIRRTGRYEHAALPERGGEGEIAGLPLREAELWLQMVREARLTRGTRAASMIWDRSPLPPLVPAGAADPEDGRACLAHLLAAVVSGTTVSALARAADTGDLLAVRQLSEAGLRRLPGALFVANGRAGALDRIFAASRWPGGRHRDALLAIPGARPEARTLAGQSVRGIAVPLAEVDHE